MFMSQLVEEQNEEKEARPSSRARNKSYDVVVRKQHRNILAKVSKRKEAGDNVLNYSSIKPYEKHMRDVS